MKHARIVELFIVIKQNMLNWIVFLPIAYFYSTHIFPLIPFPYIPFSSFFYIFLHQCLSLLDKNDLFVEMHCYILVFGIHCCILFVEIHYCILVADIHYYGPIVVILSYNFVVDVHHSVKPNRFAKASKTSLVVFLRTKYPNALL